MRVAVVEHRKGGGDGERVKGRVKEVVAPTVEGLRADELLVRVHACCVLPVVATRAAAFCGGNAERTVTGRVISGVVCGTGPRRLSPPQLLQYGDPVVCVVAGAGGDGEVGSGGSSGEGEEEKPISGCAEMRVVPRWSAVRVPPQLTHAAAAVAAHTGVYALAVLAQALRMHSGKGESELHGSDGGGEAAAGRGGARVGVDIVVTDAASPAGAVAVQVAGRVFGARGVLGCVRDAAEAGSLRGLLERAAQQEGAAAAAGSSAAAVTVVSIGVALAETELHRGAVVVCPLAGGGDDGANGSSGSASGSVDAVSPAT